MSARDLVAEIRAALRDVEERIRRHPWLDTLEAGGVSREALAVFAREQALIIPSDLRSFEGMLDRYPNDPERGYLASMVEGERLALETLEAFTAVTRPPPEDEPIPGCQAYPAFVAKLARDGSAADVAGAFQVNLDAWGSNCARMRAALRERYAVEDAAVKFFDLFASPPPDFEARSLEVIGSGIAAGADPIDVGRAARLLQAYELLYWDSLPY